MSLCDKWFMNHLIFTKIFPKYYYFYLTIKKSETQKT